MAIYEKWFLNFDQGCGDGAGAGAGAAGADTFWSEPEPPKWFARSRSRRNGAGAGAGAVKIGSAPAPKRDTVVARKQNNSEITRNSRTNSLRKFFINNLRTSAMNYLKFSWLTETCICYDLNIKQVLYQVRSCHWPETSPRPRAESPSDI